jgi:hypothetical protein
MSPPLNTDDCGKDAERDIERDNATKGIARGDADTAELARIVRELQRDRDFTHKCLSRFAGAPLGKSEKERWEFEEGLADEGWFLRNLKGGAAERGKRRLNDMSQIGVGLVIAAGTVILTLGIGYLVRGHV